MKEMQLVDLDTARREALRARAHRLLAPSPAPMRRLEATLLAGLASGYAAWLLHALGGALGV